MPEPASKPKEASKFGTFGGVFTPSTLTILGVIMFLRFGQAVGQSGIANALVIILCAKLEEQRADLGLTEADAKLVARDEKTAQQAAPAPAAAPTHCPHCGKAI